MIQMALEIMITLVDNCMFRFGMLLTGQS